MDLFTALEVRRHERIALVGGGGKTSLAMRLLAESRRKGWTALFTTTTKLVAHQDQPAPLVVLDEQAQVDLAALRGLVQREGWLILARQRLPEWDETPAGRRQKVGGFAPEEVERFYQALEPDLLVVEADGSRHRPFKAPSVSEPLIPPETTLLVALAGLSVLGRRLDGESVHRPEVVSELAEAPLGSVVDAALVAQVLGDRQGGLKGCPPAARAAAVLTQLTAERRPAGRQVARRLLAGSPFERVLLVDLDRWSSTSDDDEATELWQHGERVWPEAVLPVQAVVLAGGASHRMGRNKLLLPLEGKPLVAYAVDAALGSRAAGVTVILGAEKEAVREALGSRPVRFLENEQWAEGQAASIRTAVEVLTAESAAGALFLTGDAPMVSADHLDRLIDRFEESAPIVWSRNGDAVGVPALFGRETFPALMRLIGDIGGRALRGRFAGEVAVDGPQRIFLDVDTAEAYEQAVRWLRS